MRVNPGDVLKVSETTIRVEAGEAVAADEQALAGDGTLFRPAAAFIERAEAEIDTVESGGKRRDRLRLLNEVHRALATTITVEGVLELILDRAFAQLGPEEGVVFLRSPSGEFHRAASRRVPELTGDFLYSRSLVREVTEKGLAALVFDLSSDARFAAAESMLGSGVRSLVAAPLLDPSGCPGMIVLNSRVHLRRFSEEDMEFLVTLAAVAALHLRNIALAEEAAQRRILEKELTLAREIQIGLLPKDLPELPGFELHATNAPSRRVSGDVYKIQRRDETQDCVLMIADVSGKGMAASLLAASLEALSVGPIEVGWPPDGICERLSRRLHQRTPPEKYATAFVATVEPASFVFRYANAGHNPGVLLRAGGGVELLEATGIPLGLLDQGDYSMRSLELGPGDLIVLYTDGITEAANPAGEEYGIGRLCDACRTGAGLPLSEVALAIEKDLERFAEGCPYADDRTLILLRRGA
jgi:serine phosphatase RsbU (regulator of sigma subunit)